jgi:hypothetical protein
MGTAYILVHSNGNMNGREYFGDMGVNYEIKLIFYKYI